MLADVFGRSAELTIIHRLVEHFSDGPAAVVLQGPAGVGKTTLWRAGVDAAEGRGRVLRARPAESETALSFSGVGDLLDPVLDQALAPLASGHRRALSRALALDDEDGPAPDPRAVGVALLNGLRALAEEGPLVLAIDDMQWLDPASSSALAYAARRLEVEPVGFLLTHRTSFQSSLVEELRRSLPGHRFGIVEVGPLDVGGLHNVIQARLGITLPRPLLAEVHEASGGNPFYALEIVQMLQRSGFSPEAGQPLPVPESLHDLVHGRLLMLSDECLHFLVAVAAHPQPTIAVTEAASGIARERGLAAALDARVVELDGDRIRFTHPLLAAGAYETADPRQRSRIHARLAELLDDPEARAWQLAASVAAPDEDVAGALEDGAGHARARGAPRSAALLLERARDLTPADRAQDALRRAVDAAYLHYESGDSSRAKAQLHDLIAMLPPGHARARALLRLARVRVYESLPEAAELFLQAVREAEGDRELLAAGYEGVATCRWQLYERLDEAVEQAELAARLALEVADRGLAGEALNTQFMAESLLGRKTASATIARALEYQPAAELRRVLSQPRWVPEYLAWTGTLTRSRDELEEMLRCASELGDESAPPYVLAYLSLVECALGELETAVVRARAAQDASEQAGQRAILAFASAIEGLVEAQRGRDGHARAAATRALDLVAETGDRQAALVAAWALGHLDLTAGALDAAVARMEPSLAFVQKEGISEPCAIPFVIDHIEALVGLGRLEESGVVLDWYEGNARRLGRGLALANCLRCRGLLAAQTGAPDQAVASYQEAIDWHLALSCRSIEAARCSRSAARNAVQGDDARRVRRSRRHWKSSSGSAQVSGRSGRVRS